MNRPFTTNDIPAQIGRRVLITGTTLNGIGYETAVPLARAGAEVLLASRNPEKNAKALAALKAAVPNARARTEELDLSSLASVHALADRLRAEGKPLDILVLNAAVMQLPTRQETVDGFEMQFGTNYLGHFALTALLMPLLKAAKQPRVVPVSSTAHRFAKIYFDDPQMVKKYRPWGAYQQSKLAMVLFMLELERQSEAHGWGLQAMGAHPGFSRTELIVNGPGTKSVISKVGRLIGRFLSQSPAQGALPTLYAAASPNARPGGFYGPDGPLELKGNVKDAKIDKAALSRATATRLWALSERLTGVHFG